MIHDKYVSLIEALFKEGKAYLDIQKRIATLTLVEKSTLFISTFVIGFILVILGMIALFYLSFMTSQIMHECLGLPLWQSYGLIAVVMAILMYVVYKARRPLFVRPITKFLYNLIGDCQTTTAKENE